MLRCCSTQSPATFATGCELIILRATSRWGRRISPSHFAVRRHDVDSSTAGGGSGLGKSEEGGNVKKICLPNRAIFRYLFPGGREMAARCPGHCSGDSLLMQHSASKGRNARLPLPSGLVSRCLLVTTERGRVRWPVLCAHVRGAELSWGAREVRGGCRAGRLP